jgi:hypothetical protein
VAQYLTAVGVPLPAGAAAGSDPVLLGLHRLAAFDGTSRRDLSAVIADPVTAAALLPVIASLRSPALLPVLVDIAEAHPALESRALQQLAGLPAALNASVTIDERLIDHALALPTSGGRIAGWRIAAAHGRSPERLAAGLSDPDELVRLAAVEIMAAHGDAAVAPTSAVLSQAGPGGRLAAIQVLGRLGETDLLMAYLQAGAFQRIELHEQWRRSLPNDPAGWVRVARIAMTEADQQAIEEILATLAAVGHTQTVTYVRRFLVATDERLRARAIEAIAAVDQRNLVAPLVRLLEAQGDGGAGKALPLPLALTGMANAESAWLRRAAGAAPPIDGLHLPPLSESDMQAAQPSLLDRLLFLRSVPIFESCSLDDLHTIDLTLIRADYLPGEAVIKAGEQGEELYIVAEGEVRVGLGQGAGWVEFARLRPGAMFGEMALFDQGDRSADVIAVTPTACLVLDRARFEDLTRQRPGILMQICRLFGARLRDANQRLQARQSAA